MDLRRNKDDGTQMTLLMKSYLQKLGLKSAIANRVSHHIGTT
jgi:hypothetical protein